MYCMYCHGICDPHESRLCVVCRKERDRINERAELLYLLKMAYKHVPEIWLLERIERVLCKEKVTV